MTFQEAQARFSGIAGRITAALSPAELRRLQDELRALQDALPLSTEFDPINDAIVAVSPKLTGMIVQNVVNDIRSRTAALEGATALLAKSAQQAANDARTLNFEKPKLLVNGLTNSLAALRELRAAVANRDIDVVAAKAETLYAVLLQLHSSIKTS